jgi:hypothetical protein
MMETAGCWQGKHTAEFSALLSSVQSPPRKSIASSLGVSYSTFDNWIRGYVSFPPDRIPDLVRATGDDRFLRFILNPLGLDYYEKPNGKNSSRLSIEQHQLLIFILGGKIAEEIRRAFADRKLTEEEKKKVRERVDQEIRALVELKGKLGGAK